MIFSSLPFLLYFLPAVLTLFLLLRALNQPEAALLTLLLASWGFYAAWSPAYLALLLGSIGINYLAGLQIKRRGSQPWLALGIAFNLGLLGLFKYAGFISGEVLRMAEPLSLVLPLAISFFTFQQVAWLVDLSRGVVGLPGWRPYAFFVSFFPQLIAGPIVHARQLLPQVLEGWLARPLPWSLALGFLALGLAKKVLIADTLGPGVDTLYAAASAGQAFDLWLLWSAAAGYGAQLYFDFSGYADIAIGLGLLFGVRLPLNFNSPYQATSIIDFWRRWHITLSHFLRDYLYVPLGGSRRGNLRRYLNLLLTMLLGGLWHGAGWQFLLWGGVHGLLLVLNHAWRALCPWRLPAFLGVPLTLLAVLLAWVPFRADNLASAGQVLAGWRALPAEVPVPQLAEIFRAAAALDAGAHVGWLALAALMLACSAPASHRLLARLSPFGRGLLAAPLLLMVLKALAERPDRAFLYFNF
jgi:alginate O-acetyltransferase complex protein AlgI